MPSLSCHSSEQPIRFDRDSQEGDSTRAHHHHPRVALVGPPNSGKSTLFNALGTIARTVGNWPGTSVSVGTCACTLRVTNNSTDTDSTSASASTDINIDIELLDLPGAYSLNTHSPDEAFTHDLITTPNSRPDVVVVVMDATKLAQGLHLVAQLHDAACTVVGVVTMLDVAKSRGIAVDIERLSHATSTPMVAAYPRRNHGVDAVQRAIIAALHHSTQCAHNETSTHVTPHVTPRSTETRFAWVEQMLNTAMHVRDDAPLTWSDRIDRIVLSRIAGPLLFLVVMWFVFQATTTLAAPFQDAMAQLFTGTLSELAQKGFTAIGLGDSWLAALTINGILAGVGMLLSFLPLLAIMFTLLALLEDSGYMARAAVVTNRIMRAVGLPGRAFIPLIVGFGCNVPAITATRVLQNAHHRILTSLLIPFTSCSARLTVYVLLAATFFPQHAGTVVFTMYLISLVLVIAVGFLLRATLWRTFGNESLLIELPPYQTPLLRIVGSHTWMRVRAFLRNAAGLILASVMCIWFLQAVPTSSHDKFAHVAPEHSLFAAASRVVAPVFAPAGFDDWRTASALVVGFVAKEAVISSWAQTYATEDVTNTPKTPGQLGERLKADFTRTSEGHLTAAVWAFLVFLLAYTPCIATLGAQRNEIGMRWTLFGLALQLVVAWSLAVVVFQVMRAL